MNTKQYFFRCAVFARANNKIALADVYNPNNTSELEEWLGIVMSLADGQHTVQEFIEYMQTRYDNAPENLLETISSVFERLIEGKMVMFSEKAVQLPYYLESPIEELDLEKAKLLMEKDGYVFH